MKPATCHSEIGPKKVCGKPMLGILYSLAAKPRSLGPIKAADTRTCWVCPSCDKAGLMPRVAR